MKASTSLPYTSPSTASTPTFGAFFAKDATYVFSNYPATHGRDGIVAGAVAFWETLENVKHKLLQLIPFPGGFVSQLEITFGLRGGRTVTLPTAVITHTADGQVTDHRIYINESSLGEALQQRSPRDGGAEGSDEGRTTASGAPRAASSGIAEEPEGLFVADGLEQQE